jgi:hypothetical protein
MLAGPRVKGVHGKTWYERQGRSGKLSLSRFSKVVSAWCFPLSTLDYFVTPFSFTLHSCKRIMDSLSEEIWDVVIVGTSIPQSLLAL